MHYRKLGKTGLTVSEIGFGAWAIGGPSGASGAPLGWGKTSDDESLAAIRRARELGVTFFDTADSYGFGRSESLLGIVLSRKRERRRDRHQSRRGARCGRAAAQGLLARAHLSTPSMGR